MGLKIKNPNDPKLIPTYTVHNGANQIVPKYTSLPTGTTTNSGILYTSYGENSPTTTPTTTPITTPTNTPNSENVTETNTNTGEGNNTGDNPPKTMTYAEYLAQSGIVDYYAEAMAKIEENKNAAITYANEQKLAAEEAAKIKRERDMVNAANAYETNKATYGAKAEALADMGLTGGGYSEYIDAMAYAAQRGDVQAAIARETETNRLANNAYNEAVYNATAHADELTLKTMGDAATYKEGMFNTILQGVSNGSIPATQVEELAKKYGFTPEEINVLNGTATEYNTKNKNAVLTDIDNGDYYSADALDRMISANEITETDKNEIETYQNRKMNDLFDYYFTKGDYANFASTLDELYASKLISEDTYQSQYFRMALNNCESAEGSKEVEATKRDIDALYEQGKITATDRDNLKEYLKEYLNFKNGDFVLASSQIKMTITWKNSYHYTCELDGNKYAIDLEFSGIKESRVKKAAAGALFTQNNIVINGKEMFIYNSDAQKWDYYKCSDELINHLKSKANITTPTHTK